MIALERTGQDVAVLRFIVAGQGTEVNDVLSRSSLVKIRVSRLVVQEQSLCEVLLCVGHVAAAHDCLSVVERGEGEGGAAYGEGLLIVQLRRGNVRVVYIIVVAGPVAVIRVGVGNFARVRGRGKVNAQGVL